MKINLAKLKREGTPLYATETEIIYKQPETKLEISWNNLEKQHSTGLENNVNSNLKALFSKFDLSKIELEICETVYKLKSDKKLGEIEVQTSIQKKNFSIKTKVVKDMIKSIEEYIKMLKDAILIENATSQLIKNLDFYLDGNEIRVKINNMRYIKLYNGLFVYPKKWEPLGIQCYISYKNFLFNGYVKLEYNNEIEKIKNYFLENKLFGEYKYFDFKIILTKEKDFNNDENYKLIKNDKLCTFIVKLIQKRCQLSTIMEYLGCYLSKYFLNALLPYLNDVKSVFINIGQKMLPDGLSDIYVCIISENIIKIQRKEGSFEIFFNEKKLNIF
ncbi:hypothetical protein COBT_000462 [Conglomerata obtusa]